MPFKGATFIPAKFRLSYLHHDLLGHVPSPGFRGSGSANSLVTIDGDGLRFGGEGPISGDPAILAVGDSYTYGEEVSDTETWPAQLQRLIGRRVLNGGVSGYGLDQTVLRAEQLTALHRPSVVIVSFVADDIVRTEMRRLWWRNKPWFAIEAGQLVLKGVPVPNRTRLPLYIRHQIEQVLIKLPRFLQHLLGYHARVHPVGLGPAIVKGLTERLARLQSEDRVRIVVMAQYHPSVWLNKAFANEQIRLTRAVLGCAMASGLATLDTFQRLACEPTKHRYYASSHMNARGNLMIARLLAATLPVLPSARSG